MTELTYKELHTELKKAVKEAGNVYKFAMKAGIHHGNVYKMYKGTLKISEHVGNALGYRKKIVVTWVK